LQSVTFIIGIKALLLVVAGFYLLSLLTAPRHSEQKMRAVREFAN
jgi:glucose uptake protein GlcU